MSAELGGKLCESHKIRWSSPEADALDARSRSLEQAGKAILFLCAVALFLLSWSLADMNATSWLLAGCLVPVAIVGFYLLSYMDSQAPSESLKLTVCERGFQLERGQNSDRVAFADVTEFRNSETDVFVNNTLSRLKCDWSITVQTPGQGPRILAFPFEISTHDPSAKAFRRLREELELSLAERWLTVLDERPGHFVPWTSTIKFFADGMEFKSVPGSRVPYADLNEELARGQFKLRRTNSNQALFQCGVGESNFFPAYLLFKTLRNRN